MICVFWRATDVEHLFMCLSAINRLIVFAGMSIWNVCSFLYELFIFLILRVLCICWIPVLWETWFAKFFISSVTSLFISIKSVFLKLKHYIVMKSNFPFFFFFMGGTFGIISENILPNPNHKDLFLLCFFQIFIVSALNISVCYPCWFNFCVVWGKGLNSHFCMYF